MQPNSRSSGVYKDYSQNLELYLVINRTLAEYLELSMALCNNTLNTKN